MKKIIATILLTIVAIFATQAQIFDPVKWKFSSKQISKDEYVIQIKANIEDGWYTYSQFLGDGGPIPTTITFEKNSDIQVIGKATETSTHVKEGMDEMFGINVKKFAHDATFEQKIKVLKPTTVKGSVEFMACNNERCLPPNDAGFSITISDGKAEIKSTDTATGNKLMVSVTQTVDSSGAIITTRDTEVLLQRPETPVGSDTASNCFGKFGCVTSDCAAEEAVTENTSSWWIFFLGFLAGFAALFTPCVFPMIPLTVSYFLKSAKTKKEGVRNGVLYGFGIVLIYILFGLPFLFTKNIDHNALSTSPIVNLIYFAIFLFFAFSFLGFYELKLPDSWGNKTTAKEDSGSFLGIFFMALTLAIVSFSCTGPFVGSLIGLALKTGKSFNTVIGLTGFGVGLGLPFAVLSFFPSWLKSLPKSGGWLNTVKVVFGFIELALAVKFLSNADLVSQWGILKRELFLGLWVVIFIGLALYLFGLISFPHDSGRKKFAAIPSTLGAICIAFVIYLITGIFGADLSALSGFPPPKFYSFFASENKHEKTVGLEIYRDYEFAKEIAKKSNKKLMIDFTGWACVNCRKMEENVWTDPRVYAILKEKYVIASLYVDDRQQLPGEQYLKSKITGKDIKTVGGKWTEFQTVNFRNNSQPFYAIVEPNKEHVLNTPRGYTPDVETYIEFLQCGANAE